MRNVDISASCMHRQASEQSWKERVKSAEEEAEKARVRRDALQTEVGFFLSVPCKYVL